ncbi:MAG: MFS transporter [Pseudomonadales bacterium]|nr:MFS transporter [Pseudomonadales bacterium]MDG1909297.1 MFS transporter [Pseudomonadales bacterium]|tara:strand:- start:2880 stop:4184 length:1305 start_codon:yes stop_codon:yes gene_type:complete
MTGTMEAQRILDDVPMTRLQIAAVVLCVALNAIDGFDVLAISFAAPGIAAEWGISRGALGIVLAMELIGMAAGSVVLGSIADNLGRRPIILGCLVVMASGMYLASQATSVNALLATRFVTGVGIGGMLATTNAMVAEYSNARHRNFNVVLMATGYPVGIIIGGSLATILLAHFDWRAVFILGAAMTGVLLPAIWFLMPESISYLAQKKRPDALAQINRILTRMGHAVLEQLPASEEKSTGWRDLFSPQLARTTILLTTAYLAHIITFYFILKWIPNIVVDMEYSPASAGGILVWANVGGAVGSVLLGGLTHYFRLRSLIITALIGSIVMINVFGMGQVNLTSLAIVAGITGFFTNSAVVGLYAMLAQSYPTHLRAGGTGFVIGMGRAGAVLGPIIAGFLFEGEFSLTAVSFVMALGSLVAIFALMFLKEKAATN